MYTTLDLSLIGIVERGERSMTCIYGEREGGSHVKISYTGSFYAYKHNRNGVLLIVRQSHSLSCMDDAMQV